MYVCRTVAISCDLLYKYFMYESIQFIEGPRTEDEKEIAGVLRMFVKGVALRDVVMLKSLFTRDALIQSAAAGQGKFLKRNEYFSEIPCILHKILFYHISDIVIDVRRIQGNLVARVPCYIHWILLGHRVSGGARYTFTLVRLQGSWLIEKMAMGVTDALGSQHGEVMK